MKPVRTVARAMLASVFVVSGVRTLLQPDARVESARRVTDRVGPLLAKTDPRIPTDTLTLVRAKAASDVIAGLALATGHLTRPAAALLAAGLVPTTVAGHPFWAQSQPERGQHQVQFLKNLSLLGGLLLAAADTEGRPGLRYRTSNAVGRSKRSVEYAVDKSQGSVKRAMRDAKRAARTAKREAKIAAVSAAAARRLPG